ncbi:MAG: hypothetical protein M0P14_07255 [Alkaliphilus sp.]|nr:hypothetical protein [Alkaliphilus sp.]
MMVEDNLQKILKRAPERINGRLYKILADYAAQNTLHGTPAMKAFIEKGYLSIKEEIINALEKCSLLPKNPKQWNTIRTSAKITLTLQSDSITSKCEKHWSEWFKKDLIEPFISEVESEIDLYIDTKIAEIKTKKSEKKNTLIWDIIKIGIGVVCGYLLNYLF